MKNLLRLLVLLLLSGSGLNAQNTLFDNSRISSVYIEIPADTLNWIMANVLSDHYCKATFIYDDGTKRDTLRDVGFRLRGNTSRYSKKKSFKISFNEYVSGQRYQDVKKINLNGQHNDPTLIREKLFYDTWLKTGFVERRTSFVRLYINHAYYGLYTNLEEFDKDWLQRVYGQKDGNLYKCTYPADLAFKGYDQQSYKDISSSSSTGGRAYELQTNQTADDYSDLVTLIVALNQPDDGTWATQIEKLVNVKDLLKAFALDVATGNWDDYMYNMNNYFLYHNTATGKFEYITYDTDNTFGVDWVNQNWATRNCLDWYAHTGERPLAAKVLAVPEFNLMYQHYLDTIVNHIVKPDIIFPHIDSLKTLVTEAALEDTYRTLDWGYTTAAFYNGFVQSVDGHTPYGIKPFLNIRTNTIQQQLPFTGVVPGSSIVADIYPNPASDQLFIKVQPENKSRTGYLVDVLGNVLKVFTLVPMQENIRLQVSDIEPGIYNLVLYDNQQHINLRFVKQ